jgi:hypothetical protein
MTVLALNGRAGSRQKCPLLEEVDRCATSVPASAANLKFLSYRGTFVYELQIQKPH